MSIFKNRWAQATFAIAAVAACVFAYQFNGDETTTTETEEVANTESVAPENVTANSQQGSDVGEIQTENVANEAAGVENIQPTDADKVYLKDEDIGLIEVEVEK